MKVQFSICFRCAPRVEVFWSARAEALKMRSQANQRTCSKMPVPAWRVPLSSAHIAEHVLAGATQLVGAGRSEKTPDRDRDRKSFGHTTSKQGPTTKHV